MKITKAVIPAAGLGTRVLPATKAMPKEMFPIVDKPTIQYIVEEAVASGITDILIITNRGKDIIEDHFDRVPELEEALFKQNKNEFLKSIKEISYMANIYFIRQKEPKGLGHAILQSKSFVGNEPFAVLYGDDVIISKTPVCKHMIDLFYEFKKGIIGVQKVPEELILKYSSIRTEKIRERVFKCTDMIEKPEKNQIMSLYAILGRCILTPGIFKILESTPPGRGNEIQLTDAMKTLANKESMIAYEFDGIRHDIGSKIGALRASMHVAMNHPEIKDDFKILLREFYENLDKIN